MLNDLLLGEAAMRVAAVTGEVGTGKSHLVRWLHIEMKRRQQHSTDLQRLHIVYVPKTKTTLRSVVERILDQRQTHALTSSGSDFSARRTHSTATAPHRLLDELANSIRDLAQDELAQADAHRTLLIKELPTLLQDPVYREALLEENGCDTSHDRQRPRTGQCGGGRPSQVRRRDLHLDLSDFTDMSQKAVKTFGRLTQASSASQRSR